MYKVKPFDEKSIWFDYEKVLSGTSPICHYCPDDRRTEVVACTNLNCSVTFHRSCLEQNYSPYTNPNHCYCWECLKFPEVAVCPCCKIATSLCQLPEAFNWNSIPTSHLHDSDHPADPSCAFCSKGRVMCRTHFMCREYSNVKVSHFSLQEITAKARNPS